MLVFLALAVSVRGVVTLQQFSRRQEHLGRANLQAILGYFDAANNSAVPDDIPAIPTGLGDFSPRNGHWIFTEQYDLVAAFIAGATITQAQIFDATYNAVNIPQLYPVNEAITPLDNPNVIDLRDQPWPIPMNEEWQLQIAGGAGGAEPDYGLIWVTPSGTQPWMTAPPPSSPGAPRVFALFTLTTALFAGAWSPNATIVIPNILKGGAYQINGLWLVAAHSLAWRMTFPVSTYYGARKLSPGGLVENAYGNVPLRQGRNWLGKVGSFNYFELPQMSLLGSTAENSATYSGILDMTFLGNNFAPGVVPM
jgi:hypothetical protein